MTARRDVTRAGLSKQEAILLSGLSAKGTRIITADDVMGALRCSYANARRILSDLSAKGWLEAITRGKYLIIPLEAGVKSAFTEHEFLIAAELADPYYIGFGSALNYHGLTEQVPLAVTVATTKARRPAEIHGVTFQFVRLTEGKFFGFAKYPAADRRVNVSEPEKTLLDSLDHMRLAGGVEEVFKAFTNAKGSVDLAKLVRYCHRMGSGAVAKRLSYMLSLTGYELTKNLQRQLDSFQTTGFALLDPSRPAKGKYSRKWMLRLNVPQRVIAGEGR